MAKFKANPQKSTSAGGGMVTKVGLFAVILGGLFWVFNQFSGEGATAIPGLETGGVETEVIQTGKDRASDFEEMDARALPTSTTGEVIDHEYYTLSYSEDHEQAEWVAYELTNFRLRQDWVRRTNDFRSDPKVRRESADVYDYKRSGFDRGHMVPAGDMAFSEESMSSTFYMSNMSPQVRKFNGGIWRELEETVRDWAKKEDRLYVVTGPDLNARPLGEIGKNKVTIPGAYYKVILDYTEPEIKAVAFYLPNERSDRPLGDFIVSIDEIETRTGIDFFADLLEDDLENVLESRISTRPWGFSSKRYQRRVEEWNER